MADNNVYPILSVCATIASKVKDLPFKDGQLIFVHDAHRIALDYKGKRDFYNQIIELDAEAERLQLLAPISGAYYFVIETAVLWTYQNGTWIQVTTRPEDIVFIGTELPELGQEKMLYVDKTSREISVWDDSSGEYLTVSDYTFEATDDDIFALFPDLK